MLLDKPLIQDEIRSIRMKRLKSKEMRVKMRRLGLSVTGKELKKKEYKNGKRVRNAFRANIPKKLRQEWGARMNHLRSI